MLESFSSWRQIYKELLFFTNSAAHLSAPPAILFSCFRPNPRRGKSSVFGRFFYPAGSWYSNEHTTMRGIGEVRLSLYINLCTVTLNFFLDPLLIFGWGVWLLQFPLALFLGKHTALSFRGIW